MPPKTKTVYICTECGYESPKWLGKCPDCESWNTLVEELKSQPAATSRGVSIGGGSARPAHAVALDQVTADEGDRRKSGMPEFDRVLGGGIVDGSVVLLAGDPGIGKSTLLLQVCAHLTQTIKVLYVSGEESPNQIKLRSNRLGIKGDNLYIAASTNTEQIIETIDSLKPAAVIIDSIQTMYLSHISSSPGSVTQIRESTQLFTGRAKELGIPIFLVGHVNKDGAIAGPKVLEHMVDTVLYFEGERNLSYRILRAQKNRFGSTNEIGVFEMGEAGLAQVDNPSMMLLSGRPKEVSGTCVICLMEGTRPILAEVQALVSKTTFGQPRRTATGFDYNRMSLLIAVLEKRCGYFFGNLDAYINVVGGLRIDEPAADLAVALALASNLLDKPVGDDLAAFGEIGLAGEVRSVSQASQRMAEAYRLGFRRFLIPKGVEKALTPTAFPDAEIIPISRLSDAFKIF